MAATDVSLRPVCAEDADFLRAVYAATRMEELALTDWSDAQKAAFCRQQFEAQDSHYRAHYPTAEYSVIERGGIGIGRLYVDRWEKEIRIMDIALLPEARGANIGTKLLTELQAQAATEGKSLTIHVENFNLARRLYERLGFREIENKGVYVLMAWRLDKSPVQS